MDIGVQRGRTRRGRGRRVRYGSSRYRGCRGRRRAWISAYREDVCAVAGAEECDMALADTEDVADGGEHGYRRAERTYAAWQARRDAIWVCAGTEDVASDREDVYRSVLLSIYSAFARERCPMSESAPFPPLRRRTPCHSVPLQATSLHTVRARARVQLRRVT
jgi:hypothetical protein